MSMSIRQQVRRVLVITLALNLAVAVSKIMVGLWSGALAITADGFHSLADAASNVAALIANHLANRPPDDDHPYGHRRFETIAALGIGALLLLTAWEILTSAVERLTSSAPAPEISPLMLIVMVATLATNLFVYTYEAREGRRLCSELLTADSAHTRTDIFVSFSVLSSLGLAAVFGLAWIDTAAALVIVVLIARTAWGILRQTASVLVDTAPYSPDQLVEWIGDLPAVGRVIRARSRGPVDSVHIDIDLEVRPETTTDHTAALANTVRERLRQHVDGLTEIEIQCIPLAASKPDYSLSVRAYADALGLATHEVQVAQSDKGAVLELHVEVPPGQTLDAAHAQVTQLERDLYGALPDIAEVVTHIEPAQSDPVVIDDTKPDQQLLLHVVNLLRDQYPDYGWHHFQIRPLNAGFGVALHVALPPEMSVESAHQIAENAEIFLRARLPQIERVTIHTEPFPLKTPSLFSTNI